MTFTEVEIAAFIFNANPDVYTSPVTRQKILRQALDIIAHLQQLLDEAQRQFREEKNIVNRIWALFGPPSYEELNGKSIYDLITHLQQREKVLTEAVEDAKQTFLIMGAGRPHDRMRAALNPEQKSCE